MVDGIMENVSPVWLSGQFHGILVSIDAVFKSKRALVNPGGIQIGLNGVDRIAVNIKQHIICAVSIEISGNIQIVGNDVEMVRFHVITHVALKGHQPFCWIEIVEITGNFKQGIRDADDSRWFVKQLQSCGIGIDAVFVLLNRAGIEQGVNPCIIECRVNALHSGRPLAVVHGSHNEH